MTPHFEVPKEPHVCFTLGMNFGLMREHDLYPRSTNGRHRPGDDLRRARLTSSPLDNTERSAMLPK